MKLLDSIAEKLDNKYLTLAFILLAAFFIRIYKLGFEGLWTDEMISVYASNPNVSLRRMYDVLHFWDQTPPLYPVLFMIWLKITGFTEFNARLFSVIGGLLSLLVVYELIKELYNRRTALLITLLVSLTPYHIYFSREARSYIWSFLATALVLLFFYRQLRNYSTKYNRLFFILCGGLFMHVSYFSFFIHSGLVAIVLLTFFTKKEKVDLKNWIIDYILIGLMFLPWLMQFIRILGFHNGDNGSQPSVLYIFDMLSVFSASRAGGFILAISYAAVLLGFFYVILIQKRNFKNEYIWLTAILLFLIVFALMFMKSMGGRNILNHFMYSYVIVLFPVFLILLGGIFYASNRLALAALLAVFLIANTYHYKEWLHLSYHKKKSEPYRQMADFIAGSADAKAPILCAIAYLQEFYFYTKKMDAQLVSLHDIDKKINPATVEKFWIVDSYDLVSDSLLTEAKKRYPVQVLQTNIIKPSTGNITFRAILAKIEKK